MAENTLKITADFSQSDTRTIIASMYKQLGVPQYIPYANLDGLDDVLYPADFTEDSILFEIRNCPASSDLSRGQATILEIIENKKLLWKQYGKDIKTHILYKQN